MQTCVTLEVEKALNMGNDMTELSPKAKLHVQFQQHYITGLQFQTKFKLPPGLTVFVFGGTGGGGRRRAVEPLVSTTQQLSTTCSFEAHPF